MDDDFLALMRRFAEHAPEGRVAESLMRSLEPEAQHRYGVELRAVRHSMARDTDRQ